MSKPFEDWPEVMTIDDTAECLGLARDPVYDMFRRPDFPLLIPHAKRNKTVTKYNLQDFLKRPRR